MEHSSAFRAYLLADGWINLASYLYQVALPGIVLDLSGDIAMIGAATLASGATRMGLMAWSGSLCDRYSPRRMLLIANGVRMAIFLYLSLAAVYGWLSLPVVMAGSLAYGFSEALFLPARGAILPELVAGGSLRSANAVMMGLEKWAALAGPVMAGWATTLAIHADWQKGQAVHAEYAWPFFLQAAAAGGAMAILYRWIPGKAPRKESVLGETYHIKKSTPTLRSFISSVWQEKALRGWVMVVCGFNLVGVGPLAYGLPMLAAGQYGGSAQALGFLMSAVGCGALVGSVLPGWLPSSHANAPGRFFCTGILWIGLSLAALFTFESITVSLVAAFFASLLVSFGNVVGTTMIQRETPSEILGRMMGIINLK